MTLRDVVLNDDATYSTTRENPIDDFFVPCLSESIRYDRAVGYFSSNAFRKLAPGIDQFLKNGGHIRLIASPVLTLEDAQELKNGYQLRQILEDSISSSLDSLDESDEVFVGYLGRLIADGHLDFRIAVRQVGSRVGLFHDKFGIFEDREGNRYGFLGSNNETQAAQFINSETFMVFEAWQEDSIQSRPSRDFRKVQRLDRDFDELWERKAPGIKIYEMPEVAMEKIRALAAKLPATFDMTKYLIDHPLDIDEAFELIEEELADEEESSETSITNGPTGIPAPPKGQELRDYQKAAIQSWFDNRGRGIFKMATGTGKTFTALNLVTDLYQRALDADSPLMVVVVCPTRPLMEQWKQNFLDFSVSPIACSGDYPNWQKQLETTIDQLHLKRSLFAAAVVVARTFSLEKFQKTLMTFNGQILLIGDEVHGMGSYETRNNLPDVAFRLGLSATPERFNEDETAALFDYFGPIIFELSLKEAISMGFLARYNYFPVLVDLNPDETEEYIALAKLIGRAFHMGGDGDDEGNGGLGGLLGRRARLLGHCEAKLPAFKEEVKKRANLMYQLVYCADGFPPLNPERGEQIDEVLRFIGQEMNARAQTYLQSTTTRERRVLIERFSRGDDLQFLIAKKILDEGIDLPDARVAFLLASARNPRQAIQRRGRILRKPPHDPEKIAEIVDFIPLPLRGINDGTDARYEKKLVEAELSRLYEFADSALNREDIIHVIAKIRDRYGIGDISDDQ